MESFLVWDEKGQRYVLGPPLVSGAENSFRHPEKNQNPVVGLSYWAYGLEAAQNWRERLGLKREAQWDHVLKNLSALPVQNGIYMDAETVADTFGRGGRPAVLETMGWMPGTRVDHEIMRRSLHKVMDGLSQWHLWGVDGPMIAMTAARLGEPELAVKALLMNPKNRGGQTVYLPNGHCYMQPNLPGYLPGNGGLLAAVAMMAAGWDAAPQGHAPGFPKDGNWLVRWEGLKHIP